MGSYSGIDRSTIDQLMEIERLPLKQYTTKKTSIGEQQNAWKDINTRLNNLFDKIKTLQSADTFTSKKATSTNEDMVSISPSKNAAEGTYKISVKQLATSISVIGRNKLSETILDENGEFTKGGTFTIKNPDGVAREVKISNGDSLRDLVDSINAVAKDDKDADIKGTGITASIIDGKLVLTNEKTGEQNIELEDGDVPILEDLGLEDINIDYKDGTINDSRVIKGQKAIFSINGVEVERDSNTVSDVVDGLSINLKKQHETGQSDTVTVGLDNTKAESAIREFINQYNSTMKFIEEKLAAGDPEVPGSAGTLSGDGGLMRLHASLRTFVTSRVNGEGEGFRDISQLGVTTIDRFGQLQFDTTKFKEALAEDPQKVMDFFYGEDEKGNEVGFVTRINSYIDSFISKENGIIKSRNETYDKTIKDINKQIENFNIRMEKKEEQLIKKFTALDIAMMQAESQMTWLQGQIDAMNGIKR